MLIDNTDYLPLRFVALHQLVRIPNLVAVSDPSLGIGANNSNEMYLHPSS